MSARPFVSRYDALIDVADIQRLIQQRDDARDERNNLAADLTEAIRLLQWAVRPSSSHAVEEQVGRDIAEFLREHASSSGESQ